MATQVFVLSSYEPKVSPHEVQSVHQTSDGACKRACEQIVVMMAQASHELEDWEEELQVHLNDEDWEEAYDLWDEWEEERTKFEIVESIIEP